MWVVCYFGALFVLTFLVVALDRVLAVPGAVCGAIFFAAAASGLPGLVLLERAGRRRLAPRYGLVCPHCRQPCIAPRYRRPGQMIDVTTCPHCRGAIVESATPGTEDTQ